MLRGISRGTFSQWGGSTSGLGLVRACTPVSQRTVPRGWADNPGEDGGRPPRSFCLAEVFTADGAASRDNLDVGLSSSNQLRDDGKRTFVSAPWSWHRAPEALRNSRVIMTTLGGPFVLTRRLWVGPWVALLLTRKTKYD